MVTVVDQSNIHVLLKTVKLTSTGIYTPVRSWYDNQGKASYRSRPGNPG
jgi:excinuclease UvrABC ATPase subunit